MEHISHSINTERKGDLLLRVNECPLLWVVRSLLLLLLLLRYQSETIVPEVSDPPTGALWWLLR